MYSRRGMGELAPLLVRALDERELSALQFLHSGRVCVTLHDAAYREMSGDFMFEDTLIPVTLPDRPITTIYLRDLPLEISDESIRSALESFAMCSPFVLLCTKIFPGFVMVLVSC